MLSLSLILVNPRRPQSTVSKQPPGLKPAQLCYIIIQTTLENQDFERQADTEIREVVENKKQFLPLLLLAGEQEDMIDRYINRGTMYVLDDDGVKCQCVVTDEGDGILEIKNIATEPNYQGMGYGKAMIDFIAAKYKDDYFILQVGTGDSPLTLPFYERCGFARSHVIKNFFTDNYDHPIYEGGVQLVDMIYLQKNCRFSAPWRMNKLCSIG